MRQRIRVWNDGFLVYSALLDIAEEIDVQLNEEQMPTVQTKNPLDIELTKKQKKQINWESVRSFK